MARLEYQEIGRAADVLALAFVDEPAFAHVLEGTPRRRLRVLRPLTRGVIWGYWPVGEGHLAWLDDRIVGVGLRIPPAAWPASGRHRVRGMAAMIMGGIPAFLAFPQIRHLLMLEADQEKRHPLDRPHWYLAWLGVHPSFRRQGVASALARYVTSLADEAGVGCYTETYGEATESLYRGFDFEIRETWPSVPDGPMGRSMWREPQAPGEHRPAPDRHPSSKGA